MSMRKRQCKASLLYPHIDWKARAGSCRPTFSGRSNTFCCPRCNAVVSKLRQIGDTGIEHPNNPYNRPSGRKCRWQNCNRQAPSDKQYCSPTYRRLGAEVQSKSRSKSVANNAPPLKQNTKYPYYNCARLQRMPAEKMGEAITKILRGEARFS